MRFGKWTVCDGVLTARGKVELFKKLYINLLRHMPEVKTITHVRFRNFEFHSFFDLFSVLSYPEHLEFEGCTFTQEAREELKYVIERSPSIEHLTCDCDLYDVLVPNIRHLTTYARAEGWTKKIGHLETIQIKFECTMDELTDIPLSLLL